MGVRVRRKKGSDKWWVFINRKGHRASYSFISKAEAEAAAVEFSRLMARADAAGYGGSVREALRQAADSVLPAKVVTVGEYAKEWEAVNSTDDGWAPTTIAIYRSTLDCHILPALGHRPITEISKRAVKLWIAGVAKYGKRGDKGKRGEGYGRPLGQKTVRNVFRVLSALMASAAEDELIESSPVTRKQLPKVRKIKKPPKAWTRGQLERIDRAADYLGTRDRCLLEFLMETGCRISQTCGLQWADLDFEDNHVLIERQFVRSEVRGHTKNRNYQKLPISPDLAVRLRHHRTKQDRDAVSCGRAPSKWVFRHRHGGPVGASSYRNTVWKRLVRKAGVPDFGLHGFRHAWATHALKTAHPQEVARRMGHSTTEILETYSHVIEGQATTLVMHPLRRNAHPPRTQSKTMNEQV